MNVALQNLIDKETTELQRKINAQASKLDAQASQITQLVEEVKMVKHQLAEAKSKN